MGLWEGDAAQALFADAPEVVSAGPPTCPYHPTFLSRSAPATYLAVMEVAEHTMLFFFGLVHQIEITKGNNVDAEQEIHFAISGVAPPPPPVRPTTLLHLGNTAPTLRPPKCTRTRAWSIACPCDCNVCAPCISTCLFVFLTNWTKFARTNVLAGL